MTTEWHSDVRMCSPSADSRLSVFHDAVLHAGVQEETVLHVPFVRAGLLTPSGDGPLGAGQRTTSTKSGRKSVVWTLPCVREAERCESSRTRVTQIVAAVDNGSDFVS